MSFFKVFSEFRAKGPEMENSKKNREIMNYKIISTENAIFYVFSYRNLPTITAQPHWAKMEKQCSNDLNSQKAKMNIFRFFFFSKAYTCQPFCKNKKLLTKEFFTKNYETRKNTK